MPRHAKPSILADLDRFASIGGYLQQSPPLSLNKISKIMGISTPAVQDCIHRIEAHLGGVKLVHTTEKVAAATSLTNEGERYLEEIRRLVNWRPRSPNQLRLALSHTLLTSQILTPSLAAFQDQYEVRVLLRPGTVVMDFDQVIRDIQTDRLDLAIVWATRDRLQHDYPGVDRDKFDPPFDIVLVSRNPDDVLAITTDLSGLAARRVVTMRPENQPLVERLPPPDGMVGGERVTVDTIDAVIAHVLAGVGDLGLIVANYEVLEPLQITGRLYFSKPIDQTRLLWFGGRRARQSAREFLPFVQDHLRDAPNQPSRGWKPGDTRFPEDPGFYERFEFAYYVDHPRGAQNFGELRPPQWHWEEVRLVSKPAARGGLVRTFQGRIRNSFKDEFRATGRLVGEHLFYIQAEYKSGLGPLSSVREFVSVFNWCGQGDGKGIMYGHWSGSEPREHRMALYPTFWSWKRLTLAELRRMAHHVRARTVLDVGEGVSFDEQPLISSFETPGVQ